MSITYIAGVDEAGRGPLAGPVFAAAVILDPAIPIHGLRDSKKLSAKERNRLYVVIKQQAIAYSIARADVFEIDSINILQASLLAMQRAVMRLSKKPNQVLVDGRQLPKLSYPAQAIIGGDQSHAAISAASIMAKVARDFTMQCLDFEFPNYGFATHKGYPTKAHLLALNHFGPSVVHRRSFAPVRALLL